jgi:hypothetical protein
MNNIFGTFQGDSFKGKPKPVISNGLLFLNFNKIASHSVPSNNFFLNLMFRQKNIYKIPEDHIFHYDDLNGVVVS